MTTLDDIYVVVSLSVLPWRRCDFGLIFVAIGWIRVILRVFRSFSPHSAAVRRSIDRLRKKSSFGDVCTGNDIVVVFCVSHDEKRWFATANIFAPRCDRPPGVGDDGATLVGSVDRNAPLSWLSRDLWSGVTSRCGGERLLGCVVGMADGGVQGGGA